MKQRSDNLVCGFIPFPVKFNEKSWSTQYLYYKEHNVRDQDDVKPKARTLFVVNVPPYCDEECFKNLFSDCGAVEKVFFHKKPTSGAGGCSDQSKFFATAPKLVGYKVGYVVFKRPKALQNALKLRVTEARMLSTKEHPLLVGIRKWSQEYNDGIVNVEAMNREIDTFMADYDRRAEEEKAKAKAMEGVPDEEGWITVTRHGKQPTIPRAEAVVKKITAKERKKRSQKELLNFYNFQIRETKKEHIVQLRKKFEEDKKRIAILKASRKFRPY